LKRLRPVCSRSYLRVLACQKWGRYFLPRKGQKIFRSRAKRRVLTASGAAIIRVCWDGARNGLTGPNKERAARKEKRGSGKVTARLPAVAGWRGRKKEAWRGSAKGSRAPGFQRYGLFQLVFSLGSGAALLRRDGLRPPLGRKTNTGGLSCPALLTPEKHKICGKNAAREFHRAGKERGRTSEPERRELGPKKGLGL
jgi:hypothetical protein